MAVTAAQLNVLIRAEGAEQAERSINQVSGAIEGASGKAREAAGGFDGFFQSIQGGAGNALRALDGVSKAMGSIALVGGVTLLAGGARAAWDQVDAVQQATIALRAYETDARKVDAVLNDLLQFARSDAGRLFMRQELFHAAQVMKVAGAETQNLSRYVEIMARSVSTGMATWGDLERVLSRVVSTGRLTTVEFELLQQAGYQLDESLRNTTVTAEELFDALDRGSVRVEGQTETIQGRLMMLQSSIREVGLALLDVDSMSNFAEGGLGARIMEGLEAAPALLSSVADAARGLGEAVVGVIDFATNMVNAFRMLPDSIQSVITGLLKLIATFGALRQAGRVVGMITGMMGLGGLGTLMGGGLFRSGTAGATGFASSLGLLLGRINPVMLGITALVGVGGYLVNSFMEQKAATEAYQGSLQSLNETLEMLRIRGDRETADRIDRIIDSVPTRLEGMQPNMEEYFNTRILDDFGAETHKMWDQGQWTMPDEYRHALMQDFQDIEHQFIDMMNSMTDSHLMADFQNRFVQAINTPGIDVGAWLGWAETLLDGATNAEELDVAMQTIISRPFSDFAYEAADGMDELGDSMERTIATAERIDEIFSGLPTQLDDLRIDGLDQQADDVERLTEAVHDYFRISVGPGPLAPGTTGYVEDMRQMNEITEESAEILDTSWQRINQALASGDYDNARLMADVMEAILDPNLDPDQTVAAIAAISTSLNEYLSLADTLMTTLEVLGQSDLTSMLNLAGIGGEAVSAAADINQLAASMDTLFRVVVGNTNAIGSQFEALFKWADDLIAAEGVWSKLDDLLAAGRISGEHGVFTGDSEYARAQQAYNQIAEDNAAIQEHILTIQAKQAPLLAANASAMEEYMAAVADMPIDEQLATLGFMDSALQGQLGTVIDLAGQFSTMGAEGEAGFRAMAEGIAMTNPALFAMMETAGLVTDVVRDVDGTVLSFDVDLSGANAMLDSISQLTESIDALTLALGGIPPVRVDTTEVDPAIEKLNRFAEAARNAVQAGLDNIGVGGNNSARTGRRDASGPDTWYNTDVPIVTGLPQTGTGGTVTITADSSEYQMVVADVFRSLEAINRATGTVNILGDSSEYQAIQADVSRSLDAMGRAEASVSILGDSSDYQNVTADVFRSLDAMGRASATVSILGDSSGYQGTVADVSRSLDAVGRMSATVSILADASNVYQTIADLQIYSGVTIATSYVDIVTRRVGDPIVGRATGGVVSEDVTLVGERGPELVSLPRGSYVHTNAETMRMMNSGKSSGQGQDGNDNSITVSFAGATFSNTSREEMNKWAEDEFLPEIRKAASDLKVGMGAA